LLGYREVCGIRFTLPFGKAITIGAMPARDIGARRDLSIPREAQCLLTVRRRSGTAQMAVLCYDRGLAARHAAKCGMPQQPEQRCGVGAARSTLRFPERKAPRATRRLRNEGVGEHVRTKSQPANGAAEIADLWIRADEENCFLLPSRFSKRASPIEIRSSRLT
jgi:hypothetical protein